MKKDERKQYLNREPIAVIGINNSLACEILGYEHGIDDYVIYRVQAGMARVRKAKIHHLKADEAFRTPWGTFRLSEAIKID